MIMSNHITNFTDDLDSFCDEDTFLNTLNAFQPATNAESLLEGNYIYHDNKRGIWIRSGTATARGGFFIRNKAHFQGSGREGHSFQSNFYARYPRKDSRFNRNNARRRGYFENLTQCVGIGMDFARIAKLCCTSASVEGAPTLFRWEDDDLCEIWGTKFGDCPKEEKQFKMLGYAFEKAYNLALSPTWNVSGNPGNSSTEMGLD
jgi:hypothetical protein